MGWVNNSDNSYFDFESLVEDRLPSNFMKFLRFKIINYDLFIILNLNFLNLIINF
jgi:hypothetical protein